eukprot:1846955-Rhodomonas_salina.1
MAPSITVVGADVACQCPRAPVTTPIPHHRHHHGMLGYHRHRHHDDANDRAADPRANLEAFKFYLKGA